jgi:MFS family permease
MNAPRLGNRNLKLALGWLVGCVLGVLLALPFALWFDVRQVRPRRAAERASAEQAVTAGLGVVAVLGGTLGMGVTHLLTTLPAGRRRTAVYAALGAFGGSLLGGLIGAMCYLDFARQPIPFHRQIELPLTFLTLFTLVGAILGLLAGTGAAEEREKHERDAMLRKLDAQRAETEASGQHKPGPLDEARRETIKPADADHLTEARRFEEAEP